VIFLTVGSSIPFDRLVRAVDDLVGQGLLHDVRAQIGEGAYEPRHMAFERFLDKQHYDLRVDEATALIGHAGAGTISMALERHKPLLVMPRLRRHGEIVNDHQVATARTFARLGHILVARDVDELRAGVEQLGTFVPRPREPRARDLARRIGVFLGTVSE
jgi:UDP-N-acetylglucosamine transferase subunit ALG13